jgi:hypothetical protein
VDALAEIERRATSGARDDLPGLLGKLVEIEARVRLRLSEAPPAPAASSEPIDAERACEIAGSSRRWLLANTRGRSFRRDLSRKQPRFDEAGLRAWLASSRGHK